MKKFHFSLRAVHEIRHAEEQTAQKRFADAVCAYEDAAARLVILDRDLQHVWQGLRRGSLEGMSAVQMLHGRAWGCVLEDRRKQLVEELRTQQQRLDAAQKQLQVATQHREALDRLLRKQWRAHEQKTQREEQKFLDELATRGAWLKPVELEAA